MALSPDDAALLRAVGEGALEIVRALCARGASPCAVDITNTPYGPQRQCGLAALHLAMNKQLPHAIAELLIRTAPDINVTDDRGATALHHVIERNGGATRTALVAQLLATGADPHAADQVGNTPLFELWPFNEGTDELAVLEQLHDADVQLDHKNLRNETLIDRMFAAANGFERMVVDKPAYIHLMSWLFEHGVEPADRKWTPHVMRFLDRIRDTYVSKPKPKPKAAPKAKAKPTPEPKAKAKRR